MGKLLLLLALMFSCAAEASTYIGYSHSYHLLQSNLNDSHPYIGYTQDNFGAILYQSSFDKAAVGVYYEYALDFLKIKFGATTGYTKHMTYGGSEYTQYAPFITPDVMLLVVPSVEYNCWVVELVGDAINVGVKLDLGKL